MLMILGIVMGSLAFIALVIYLNWGNWKNLAKSAKCSGRKTRQGRRRLLEEFGMEAETSAHELSFATLAKEVNIDLAPGRRLQETTNVPEQPTDVIDEILAMDGIQYYFGLSCITQA